VDEEDRAASQPSPALAEARKRRADLHAALISVEEAISGPAVGREDRWSAEVAKRLTGLRDALGEHIVVTERPEGLYDEIRAQAPRLASAVQSLQEEHGPLRDDTAAMIDRLSGDGIGEGWPLAQARDDLQRLLGRFVRHRQLGADLVWDAYNLDIGGIE
jgi:hypothetical protein